MMTILISLFFAGVGLFVAAFQTGSKSTLASAFEVKHKGAKFLISGNLPFCGGALWASMV